MAAARLAVRLAGSNHLPHHSMKLPDELTPQEHGVIKTALLELETRNAAWLKDSHWSPEMRAGLQRDMEQASALREKLREVYLVPMARHWSKGRAAR